MRDTRKYYWKFIIWLIVHVKYFIFAILISFLNFHFDSSLKIKYYNVIYPVNNIFLYNRKNGERSQVITYKMWSCLKKDWETLF